MAASREHPAALTELGFHHELTGEKESINRALEFY